METITLERAQELLAKAVETQGRDFVYNPGGAYVCYYAPLPASELADDGDPRGKTGCVVGVALDLAGETGHHRSLGGVQDLVFDNPELLTDEATSYFQQAQWEQDKGRTWGEAFDAAEEVAAELLAGRGKEV